MINSGRSVPKSRIGPEPVPNRFRTGSERIGLTGPGRIRPDRFDGSVSWDDTVWGKTAKNCYGTYSGGVVIGSQNVVGPPRRGNGRIVRDSPFLAGTRNSKLSVLSQTTLIAEFGKHKD